MTENETKILSPEERIPEIELLISMLEGKRFSDFKEAIVSIPAVDIAALFHDIPDNHHFTFYRLLPKELAAEVFVEMDSELQEKVINSYTDTELSAMVQELYLDDMVDIIEEMPANVVKRILRTAGKENREIINSLLNYPKNTAGTIMTTEYVRFTKDMTVEKALEHIRRVAIDKETIYTCYITDKQRHLEGIVTAKELLISPLETTLEQIMEESVIFVNTIDNKEDVANKFNKYGFLALPVVDNECRLVGIVTIDDAIDVLKEEAEEDFAKMAAITPSETPYIRTNAFSIWKARIPWLLLLMISATFTGMIITGFESSLASQAVLIAFIPMLMGTGGNSGSQSSVTVIRALSLDELKLGDIFRVVWKEIRTAVLCGLCLSVACFIKIWLVDRMLLSNPDITLMVDAVICISLFITVISAKIVGAVLPMLAQAIKLDPAVMASPFITSIIDVLSLIVYFRVATVFLGI